MGMIESAPGQKHCTEASIALNAAAMEIEKVGGSSAVGMAQAVAMALHLRMMAEQANRIAMLVQPVTRKG